MTPQERKQLARRLTTEYRQHLESQDFFELFGGRTKATLTLVAAMDNAMAAAVGQRVRAYGRRLAAMFDAELLAHVKEDEQ
jgi:hypothetical protein